MIPAPTVRERPPASPVTYGASRRQHLIGRLPTGHSLKESDALRPAVIYKP